ncbi:E3 ubiquitin-protein ligase TRIM39-like [Hyperolius riggenbachi]|uniref:E3 ubiquitin-protein ligase TRIM39-like n=1 Tax=Hyperolius riggenbachi TaxID=752182 RepID=UPI0035A26B0C
MSTAQGGALTCTICQNIYRNPVSLKCGHGFCRGCIITVLEGQEESGRAYACPQCKKEYPERPLLEEYSPMQIETMGVFCTYCLDSRVAAVKTCRECETSMCERHLKTHKTVIHLVLEPTSTVKSKICSIHDKPFEFSCIEDDVLVCAFCCLIGKHKGHKVKLLEEASRGPIHQKPSQGSETAEKIQMLQGLRKKIQEQADNERKRVEILFHDLRRELKFQEIKVLSEISRQEEQISLCIFDQMQQLETQRDEQSMKISSTESPSLVSDPINVSQAQELQRGDQGAEGSSATDLDDFLILFVLHKCITEFILQVESQTNYPISKVNDLFLDGKTAHNLVALSYDLKMASSTKTGQKRRDVIERFTKYRQVLSMESFSSGRHYWEVEVSDCGYLDIGVCYESIDRKGEESSFGENKKSWCIGVCENEYLPLHDSRKYYSKPLDCENGGRILGIYLDYDAGYLSFYQVGNPMKRLHVFTTTFTEPLRAAFYVNDGAWVRIVH